MRNGNLDDVDLDFLFSEIRNGVNDVQLDLDGNGLVNAMDANFWVQDIKGTHLGDANLDYSVDEMDFELWESQVFSGETGWAEGDFNGDGRTDVRDFHVWNDHKFMVAQRVVPEPVASPYWIILAGVRWLCGGRGDKFSVG